MGRVQSSLVINDQMSRALGRINKAMGSVLDSFEAVQRASSRSFNTANISSARREIGAADAALNEMEQSYRDCNNQQQQLNKHIGQGSTAAGGLLGKIKGIASAYLGMKTVTGLAGLSDTITQTNARLSMMNDGSQTTSELNSMIYASAQRSRGLYLETADAVAKLGLMAGDAFSNNMETIAFMEQVNKQFKIAGTSTAGIDAARLQLTQAMGSGVLRGEEYNSILEQAPNIIQTIADYLEVPKGKLKDMAAEGQITAGIVKNAMFAAADETNAKFESMPKTWSDIWTSMKNRAIKALNPVLAKINQLANSEKVQRTVNGLMNGFAVIASVALGVFDAVCNIYNFIADNWTKIEPFIWEIVGALVAYKLGVLAVTAAEWISNSAKIAYALATGAKTVALNGETLATGKAAKAQWGLNTAMFACPITWIIVLIIALIAVFIALWENCEGFRNFFVDMWAKTAKSAGDFYNNVFVPVANGIADFQNKLVQGTRDATKSIINFVADMAISLIENFSMVSDSARGMLNIYNKMASAFGWKQIDINFAVSKEGINAIRNKYLSNVDKVFNSSMLRKWNLADLDEWNKWVDESADKARNFSVMGWIKSTISDVLGTTDQYKNNNNNTTSIAANNALGNIKDDTGIIASSVDKTEEELRYLRDIAEREAINRFTTAKVSIDMTGMTNKIDGSMDIDGVVSLLTDGFVDALTTAAEGVHV